MLKTALLPQAAGGMSFLEKVLATLPARNPDIKEERSVTEY